MIVVGIGSSAGGLEAIREVVKAIPHLQHTVLVIAQHLSPHHTSILADLVRKGSRLDVRNAEDGHVALAGQVLITPPGKDIEIIDRRIRLTTARSGPMPKPDINRFFASLAMAAGETSVGVILSGTGTDGAVGVKEIKDAGGIAIVQTPESAKYDGMPHAAIHTGAADLVATPMDIGAMLYEFDQTAPTRLRSAAGQNGDTYDTIVKLIRSNAKIELPHFKRSNIERRIARRMVVRNSPDLPTYLRLLEAEPGEVGALTQDVFCSVTSFFRDPEAYAALSQVLERKLCGNGYDELRIWIPGCATGEEAYSVAILMEELGRQSNRSFDYRVFATDVNSVALNTARFAHYAPSSVAHLDKGLVERYFHESQSRLQIARHVRDRLVFSAHDLTRDAPFSRLDLISCRNLLNFFDDETQIRALEILHFGLSPKGLLMLGQSDAELHANDLFAPVDSTARIYQSQQTPGRRRFFPSVRQASGDSLRHVPRQARRAQDVEMRLLSSLAERFAPASAVIDRTDNLVYRFGDPRALLPARADSAQSDLFRLAGNTVRPALRSLVIDARRAIEKGDFRVHSVLYRADDRAWRLTAKAFDAGRPGWLMITFEEIAPRNAQLTADTGTLGQSSQLAENDQDELLRLRETLDTVVEELETTNEDLQATNEELQSSNEEFQSTNEELQTTNEELQSSNEELLTLNDELQERSRAYEQLNAQLESILAGLATPLLMVDADLRLVRVAPVVKRLMPVDDIHPQDHLSALPWRDPLPDLRPTIHDVIASGRSTQQTLQIGASVWQLTVSRVSEDCDGRPGAVLVFTDSSELYESREHFRQEKERAQITLQSIGDGVIRVSQDGNIEYINPAAANLIQVDTEQAIGASLERVLTLHTGHGEAMGNFALDFILAHLHNSERDKDCILTTLKGDRRHITCSITLTTNERGAANGAVLTFKDMTDHYAAISRMSWMTSHDDLTGAVNRREMEQRLETALMSIRQGRKRELVFLYLDLDQFKVVNDSCGHLAGDELLKQVTRILAEHIRTRDTLARLGGDEFGILLEGCRVGEAEGVAEKIRAAIHEHRFHWEDKVFRIGISIGIAALTSDIIDVSDIMKHADAACYAAKDLGRNRIHIHSPDDDELTQQRSDLHWLSALTGAMENDRLRLYMQKIQHSDRDSDCHWEVLLRMIGEDDKLLLPGSFLPAAERYGLIQRIDEWVVDQLFRILHEHRPASGAQRPPNVNVNLSGASFTDARLTEFVNRCLERYDVDPSRLTFEITETAAISNMSTAKAFIGRAHDLGCMIALDDFGSGMSSFKYLKQLDVDYVKIDGTFIKDIETDSLSQAIVEAMVRIAANLDVQIVAEFAENQRIVAKLKEFGVHHIQGYAIAKPIAIDVFLERTSMR